jgi:hypothetical protein
MSRSIRRHTLAGAIFLSFVISLLVGGCRGNPDASGSFGAAADQAAETIAAPRTAEPESAPPGQPTEAVAPAMPRKIIYAATVEMVCTDFAATAKKLLDEVRSKGGYVAETNVIGASNGKSREGTWKVRVPIAQFDAFMAALSGVGEVQSSSTTSQDVSEEYYDIEARLKNKRVEEARLIDHLRHSTAKLSDILMVEKEISRVQEEIERMEGRQRFLANQTDYSTVTITVRELTSLAPRESPTLWTQIGRTFTESVVALGEFGRGLALLVVGLLPWAAVGAGVGLPVWRIVRRRQQRKAKASAVAKPPAGDV